MVESFIQKLDQLTDNQVMELLTLAFRQSEVSERLREMMNEVGVSPPPFSRAHFYTGQRELTRSASCGAWMPVRTVILCVAMLRIRGCTPCDAAHLSLHNHERKPSVCQPVTSHGFLLSLHVLLDNTVRMGYNYMNFL